MREYYDYDQYDIDPHSDEWVHLDDLPDLDYARQQMQKVLEALYGGATLESLESSLEEVLHVLEMKAPTGPLTVHKEAANG